MSEEINQKKLQSHGVRFKDYELYNLGSTTLNQLKKFNIIPNKDYGEYSKLKPDLIIVDRRDLKNIKVILNVEFKEKNNFKNQNQIKSAIQQANTLGQIIGSKISLATDHYNHLWINPNQWDNQNEYFDEKKIKRSYSFIKNVDGTPYNLKFSYEDKIDLIADNDMNFELKDTYTNLKNINESINTNSSTINKSEYIDPSKLARQVWQDLWTASGATPEKCLYTFLELFIFKYLSDLDLLKIDDDGNDISFEFIYEKGESNAFKYYSKNLRNYLEKKFPPNPIDKTGIINGTVLSPKVDEHSVVFFKILKKFNEFGKLRNIDPNFKSMIFEEFMKKSISKRNWGQYFTPRNIINSIIQIADIDTLPEGSKICDPACGVGGFLLEPIKINNNGISAYFKVDRGMLQSKYKFIGYDKGFEQEEKLTIILAKANMLIFLSDLLQNNSHLTKEFSDKFNETFELISDSILGTLKFTNKDHYDLILTNPPYAVSGSSSLTEAIKNNSELNNFYKINGTGPEEKFVEWIINSLKPNRKGFIIIPDGILSRSSNKLRKYIKEQCIIDAIISLPKKSFYTTPKKTYILAITKKDAIDEVARSNINQKSPVFTYLVSEIGETLDVNRFPTPDKNDLKESTILFNQFKGSKDNFISQSKRCKIFDIDQFDINKHWCVDRWWSKEEKIQLGIEEKDDVVSIHEFKDIINDFISEAEIISKNIDEIINE